MGLFTPAKKIIDKEEVKIMMGELDRRGIKQGQRDFIEKIVLNAHMDPGTFNNPHPGIDEEEVGMLHKELSDRNSQLRKELTQKGISDDNIKYLQEELDTFLNQTRRKGIFG